MPTLEQIKQLAVAFREGIDRYSKQPRGRLSGIRSAFARGGVKEADLITDTIDLLSSFEPLTSTIDPKEQQKAVDDFLRKFVSFLTKFNQDSSEVSVAPTVFLALSKLPKGVLEALGIAQYFPPLSGDVITDKKGKKEREKVILAFEGLIGKPIAPPPLAEHKEDIKEEERKLDAAAQEREWLQKQYKEITVTYERAVEQVDQRLVLLAGRKMFFEQLQRFENEQGLLGSLQDFESLLRSCSKIGYLSDEAQNNGLMSAFVSYSGKLLAAIAEIKKAIETGTPSALDPSQLPQLDAQFFVQMHNLVDFKKALSEIMIFKLMYAPSPSDASGQMHTTASDSIESALYELDKFRIEHEHEYKVNYGHPDIARYLTHITTKTSGLEYSDRLKHIIADLERYLAILHEFNSLSQSLREIQTRMNAMLQESLLPLDEKGNLLPELMRFYVSYGERCKIARIRMGEVNGEASRTISRITELKSQMQSLRESISKAVHLERSAPQEAKQAEGKQAMPFIPTVMDRAIFEIGNLVTNERARFAAEKKEKEEKIKKVKNVVALISDAENLAKNISSAMKTGINEGFESGFIIDRLKLEKLRNLVKVKAPVSSAFLSGPRQQIIDILIGCLVNYDFLKTRHDQLDALSKAKLGVPSYDSIEGMDAFLASPVTRRFEKLFPEVVEDFAVYKAMLQEQFKKLQSLFQSIAGTEIPMKNMGDLYKAFVTYIDDPIKPLLEAEPEERAYSPAAVVIASKKAAAEHKDAEAEHKDEKKPKTKKPARLAKIDDATPASSPSSTSSSSSSSPHKGGH